MRCDDIVSVSFICPECNCQNQIIFNDLEYDESFLNSNDGSAIAFINERFKCENYNYCDNEVSIEGQVENSSVDCMVKSIIYDYVITPKISILISETEEAMMMAEREAEEAEEIETDNSEIINSQGKIGEIEFQKWLDKSGLGYIYVNQEQKTFATLFKGSVKRPDFLVLIDSIGLIAVDVKNFSLSKYDNKSTYTLSMEEELKKTLTFERLFRIPVWYAYAEKDKYSKWSWISALKAVEVGKLKHNKRDSKDFLAIDINKFIEIHDNDDIGKLWTQRHNDLSNISELK